MADPMGARTVLTDLCIWNGLETVPADTLILNGPRIESLCRNTALAPGDRRVAIPLPGMTAIPGLIDAHVHMVLNPERSSPPGAAEAPDLEAMRARAAAMVRAGITTARDLGGGAWAEIDLRDAIARGECPGPRLLCSGQPITCPGGHCHFWGGEAADLAAAARLIDRQLERGADLIKVMATGGRFTRGSTPAAAQFDTATLTEMVAYARDRGLPVAAHCHGTPGIEAAARAGVHSIEHCSWVGEAGWASDYRPEVVELMVAAGTWVSPTINLGWQRLLNSKSTTPERMGAALTAMRGAGVPIMASTDAGIPGVFHHQLPQALAVFAAVAGLTPPEVLRYATSAAASGLGLAGKTGQLVESFAADVLVVDGDPLEDLGALDRPAGVWAEGRQVLAP